MILMLNFKKYRMLGWDVVRNFICVLCLSQPVSVIAQLDSLRTKSDSIIKLQVLKTGKENELGYFQKELYLRFLSKRDSSKIEFRKIEIGQNYGISPDKKIVAIVENEDNNLKGAKRIINFYDKYNVLIKTVKVERLFSRFQIANDCRFITYGVFDPMDHIGSKIKLILYNKDGEISKKSPHEVLGYRVEAVFSNRGTLAILAITDTNYCVEKCNVELKVLDADYSLRNTYEFTGAPEIPIYEPLIDEANKMIVIESIGDDSSRISLFFDFNGVLIKKQNGWIRKHM